MKKTIAFLLGVATIIGTSMPVLAADRNTGQPMLISTNVSKAADSKTEESRAIDNVVYVPIKIYNLLLNDTNAVGSFFCEATDGELVYVNNENYSTVEIASILHKKESTIRSLLSRGRNLLKEVLKEEYDFE